MIKTIEYTINILTLFLISSIFTIIIMEYVFSPNCNKIDKECLFVHHFWLEKNNKIYIATNTK
jgi:antibiotic biosynthesis monooxygenase (ABM) superfamily enzyme